MPVGISYRRFSSRKQEAGHSLERQTQAAKQYAQEHGLDLDTSLTFDDLGVSAWKGKNVTEGALGRLIEAIEAGEIPRDAWILLESWDRASRMDPWDMLPHVQRLINTGVTVVTLSDRQVYNLERMRGDITALITLIVVAMRAADESNEKSRRVRRAWAAKREAAASGKAKLTATIPGWLRLDPETGEFEVNEEAAETVRLIFEWYVEGAGVTTITKRLHAQGRPTFGRGKEWSRSYVMKLIGSRAVLGEFTTHTWVQRGGKAVREPQQTIPDYYPQILSEDLFERVQAMRKSRQPRRGKAARRNSRNIFGGTLKCGRCGGGTAFQNKGKSKDGKSEFLYVVCRTAARGAGCKYNAVRIQALERALLHDLDRLLAEALDGRPENALGDAITAKQNHLDEVELQIHNVSYALRGRRSEALEAELEALEAERAEARKELRALRADLAIVDRPLLEKRLGDLARLLQADELDRTRVNAALRQCVERVVLDIDAGRLVFRWHGGAVSEAAYDHGFQREPGGWRHERPQDTRKAGEMPTFDEDAAQAA